MVGRIKSGSKKQTRLDADEDNNHTIKKKMKSPHPPHNYNHEEEASRNPTQSEEEDENEDEDEDEDGDANPIGDIVRVSADDHGLTKNYFNAFQFDGRRFQIDDCVLVTPEEGKIKPSVVIIKDIFQPEDGNLMVNGQRLYRPEEAEKKDGGTWLSRDHRELFFSRNFDQVPADSVMHKCVIHLVPLNTPPPDRKVNPGFIVKKVYDIVHRRLRVLTDKDCKDVLPPKAMS